MRALFKSFGVWLLAKAAFAIGLAGISGAVVIVAGQCISWMAFGTWPEISILQVVTAFGRRPPTSLSPGVQIVSNWILALPLSIVVLLIGLGVRQGFMLLADRYRPEPTER
jgi:hypothetical protein